MHLDTVTVKRRIGNGNRKMMKFAPWLLAIASPAVTLGQESMLERPSDPNLLVGAHFAIFGDAKVRADSGRSVMLMPGTPLKAGDELEVASGGRAAEILLGKGCFLRVRADSKITILDLGAGRNGIQIVNGTVTVFVLRESSTETAITTAHATVRVLHRSEVRIDTGPGRSTQITVLAGNAGITRAGQAEQVGMGQSWFLSGAPSHPALVVIDAATARDDWDAWNTERDRYWESLLVSKNSTGVITPANPTYELAVPPLQPSDSAGNDGPDLGRRLDESAGARRNDGSPKETVLAFHKALMEGDESAVHSFVTGTAIQLAAIDVETGLNRARRMFNDAAESKFGVAIVRSSAAVIDASVGLPPYGSDNLPKLNTISEELHGDTAIARAVNKPGVTLTLIRQSDGWKVKLGTYFHLNDTMLNGFVSGDRAHTFALAAITVKIKANKYNRYSDALKDFSVVNGASMLNPMFLIDPTGVTKR